MATNIQRAIIGGRLTKDPELKQTKSGTLVCPFTIAVNRIYSGDPKSEFAECVAFNKTAEKIARFFTKGKEIIVFCNAWTTKQWKTKDGTRYNSVEFKADDFCFVGVNPNDPAQQVKHTEETPKNSPYFGADDTDGDLPF